MKKSIQNLSNAEIKAELSNHNPDFIFMILAVFFAITVAAMGDKLQDISPLLAACVMLLVAPITAVSGASWIINLMTPKRIAELKEELEKREQAKLPAI